jgi:2-phospho-L-lactate guanylyltransferase
MKTLAILPVKALGAAKQRLSPALGEAERRALAEAMLGDVLSALGRTRGLDGLLVVTADPAARAAALAAGAQAVDDREQAGQSPAAAAGIAHALASGFERALLVPGDTPLLDPRELDELLELRAGRSRAVSIVPDRHGTGTNALLLAPPDAIEPSFGPGSCARHEAAAAAAGLEPVVARPPTLVLDVDTGDDLGRLEQLLAERSDRAPRTRAALRGRAGVAA